MTKHYKLHELTTEVLVEMFGDSSDWYSVLKNGKRVGSFSDLRKAIIKRQEKEASKLKQKREQSELNKSNTVRSTSDAKRFFESELKNAATEQRLTNSNLKRPTFDEVDTMMDERSGFNNASERHPEIDYSEGSNEPAPVVVEPPKPKPSIADTCDRQKNRLHWELFGEPAPGCDL